MNVGYIAVWLGTILILSGIAAFFMTSLSPRMRRREVDFMERAGPIRFGLSGSYPEIALTALGVILVIVGVFVAR